MIKCYIALGNLTAASRSLQDLKSRDPNNSSSYASETTNINRLKDLEISADKDMNNNDYRKVSCTSFKLDGMGWGEFSGIFDAIINVSRKFCLRCPKKRL